MESKQWTTGDVETRCEQPNTHDRNETDERQDALDGLRLDGLRQMVIIECVIIECVLAVERFAMRW
jgi:hypothetical protein